MTDNENRSLRGWVTGQHWSWNFDRVDGATTRFNRFEDAGGVGWVAGTGTNSALAARHGLAHNAAAACHGKQSDAFVRHERLRRFYGWLCDGSNQVGWTARANDRLVQKSDVCHGALARVRMHVEDDAVSG